MFLVVILTFLILMLCGVRRPWALVLYCLSSSNAGAAHLRLEHKAALAGKRTLSAWLTPLKAAGLESAWVEFMRNP